MEDGRVVVIRDKVERRPTGNCGSGGLRSGFPWRRAAGTAPLFTAGEDTERLLFITGMFQSISAR